MWVQEARHVSAQGRIANESERRRVLGSLGVFPALGGTFAWTLLVCVGGKTGPFYKQPMVRDIQSACFEARC